LLKGAQVHVEVSGTVPWRSLKAVLEKLLFLSFSAGICWYTVPNPYRLGVTEEKELLHGVPRQFTWSVMIAWKVTQCLRYSISSQPLNSVWWQLTWKKDDKRICRESS